jgi:hypothetical protein
MECPITVFPFVRRQHAQLAWKQLFAFSCLQIEHMHGCVVTVVVIFFSCFDFASTYNLSATSGTPIMKGDGVLSQNATIDATFLKQFPEYLEFIIFVWEDYRF